MSPLKSARGPLGPEKKLRALVKAPGTLRAAPRGALGPPRGTFAGHVTLSFLLLVLHKPAKVPKITTNHKKNMRFPENHDKSLKKSCDFRKITTNLTFPRSPQSGVPRVLRAPPNPWTYQRGKNNSRMADDPAAHLPTSQRPPCPARRNARSG